MDVVINPDQLAIMMLYSLPTIFKNFRVTIESRDDLPDPETLRTKIIEESDARKNAATSSQSQDALFVRRKQGRTKENPIKKEDRKNEKPFWFKCHGKGHKAFECPFPEGRRKRIARVPHVNGRHA